MQVHTVQYLFDLERSQAHSISNDPCDVCLLGHAAITPCRHPPVGGFGGRPIMPSSLRTAEPPIKDNHNN